MVSTLSFLIDECLTPDLTHAAERFGHFAFHVRDLGLLSAPDLTVVRAALAGDRVMVTNNRRDYLRIYAHQELHPGLIVILPRALADEQIKLFALALSYIEKLPDLINKLIEVGEGGDMAVSYRPAA